MTSGFETSRSHFFCYYKDTLVMRIRIKEKNNKESLRELNDNHGKFELTKPQISKGNVLQLQFGNKNLSIVL